jgi:hypothetical protein
MPTSPLGGWPEYAHLGPSLNAVTALGLGWVDAHTYDLAGGIPTDFELRSRHWGGRNPTLPRQALEVRAADGKTYVVEFRENAAWDAGQQTPALIVAQGKGSTADVAYPNSHSGTYLSLLRFPITLGSIGSAYLAPGFAIEVLDWSPGTHSVRIRVTSGQLKRTFVQSSSKVELVQTVVLERGMTTWQPGEKLCVEGTFQYNKLSKSQAATFEMTYGLAVPPTTATWIVEGTTLTQSVQTVSVTKEVRVANAKLDAAVAIRTVTIHCSIQTLPTGSALRLTNVPADESYDVAVTGTIRTAVGSATETFLEEFEGIEYDYGRDFNRARLHCLADLSDPGSRYATYEVLVEPDLWRKIPKKRHERLELLAKILGRLRSRDDQTAYNLGVKELPAVIGVASAELRVLPRSVAMGSALPQGHPAPPAQDLQGWSAPTDEELTSVLKPSIKFSSDAE